MADPIGHRRWAIAEGYIPSWSHGPEPQLTSHETRRTRHIRFNQLDDPEPIPKDADYASALESDVPVVVQHTRLDSRQAELALLSTIAYAAD